MKRGIIIVLVTFLFLATGYAGNLLIDNVSLEPGETVDLKMSLSSTVGNYVGLQFDLTLPDGFSLEKGDDGKLYKMSSGQPDDMDCNVQDLGSGTNRFVFYSNTLQLLKKGDLLSFKLKASSSLSLGNYTISVGGIALSDEDGTVTKESEINATAIVAGTDNIVITVKNTAREYAEANPTFEYTVKGGALEGVPEMTCEATEASPVGTYDIVASKGTIVSPNVTFLNGTLAITKAPLKIKVGNYTRMQGEDNPEFTLEYEGFKRNETKDVLTKQPKVSTKAKKNSPAGEYPITISGAEAQNYEISYINGILTVEKIEEEIPENVSIKITGAKQVPYCCEYSLDFTDLPDLKAYVATGYDKAKGTIWLTRVKQVPAETGFLLIGDPGDYDIPTIDGGSEVYYKNMFKGTLTGTTIYTTEGEYTNYYLSSGTSGVGFYKVTNENGVSIKANRCYLPILTNIPADGAEGDAEVIKVSAAKQVPYYTSKNVDFTSLDAQGVKAYTATGYNYTSGVIWLTRVKKVPAKTGILVMADKEGEYSVPTTSVQSIYENMFVGSETAQTIYTTETVGDIEYINYYLSNGTSGVGFYKVTNEDGVKMGANRSYLQIPYRATSGARGMGNTTSSFSKMVISDDDDDVIAIPVFGGDATGISDVHQRVEEQEVYYNLQGLRVDKPGKGIYIHNGKVIVRK